MEVDENKLRAILKHAFDMPTCRSFAIDNDLDPGWLHKWMNGKKTAGIVLLKKINSGIDNLDI